VNTRTTRWLNLTNHLRIHFSDFATVHHLLDSPKVSNRLTCNCLSMWECMKLSSSVTHVTQIVLMVTNTHVDPQIGNHSKVRPSALTHHTPQVQCSLHLPCIVQIICVPLGLRGRDSLYGKMRRMVTTPYNKTTLLRINNSGWGER
jgi:hypothetical protein